MIGKLITSRPRPVLRPHLLLKRQLLRQKAKAESDTESLAGAMGDLSAQIAEMESQELSAEDQEKLQEIKGLMNDLEIRFSPRDKQV